MLTIYYYYFNYYKYLNNTTDECGIEILSDYPMQNVFGVPTYLYKIFH
jgi:hypothetical protein